MIAKCDSVDRDVLIAGFTTPLGLGPGRDRRVFGGPRE
jgi:hypothetical protein